MRESSVPLVPQRTTGVFQNYLGTNGSSEIAALKAIKCRNIFAKFPFVFFLSLSKTTVSMCSLRIVAKMWSKTTSLCTEDAAPVLGKDILLIVSHPQGSSGQERKGSVST